MTIFCSKCGVKGAQNAVFCGSCGAKLNIAEPNISAATESKEPEAGNATGNDNQARISLPANDVSTVTLSTGDQIRLVTFVAEVIASRESETTQIHQGTMIRDGRHEPGYISSSVTTTKKVWLRENDGLEHEYDLSDADIALREGHLLKITQGGSPNAATQLIMRIENLSTGDCYINPHPNMETIHERAIWTFDGIDRFKDFLKVHVLIGSLIFIFFLQLTSFSNALMIGGIAGAIPSGIIYLFAAAFGITPGGRRRRLLVNEIGKAIRTN